MSRSIQACGNAVRAGFSARLIMCVALLCLSVAQASSSAGSPAEQVPLPGPAPASNPVVQARLQYLMMALITYSNDHNGWYPSDPQALYPDYVSAPSMFWNPGDNNPEPTTINNSVRDAANSSRISFDFPIVGKRDGTLNPWDVAIVDHSPANNGGTGIHVAYCDGHVAFIPMPLPDDVLERAIVAQQHLRSVWIGIATWANNHNGQYPSDLTVLYPSYIADPAAFWNPGDSNPMPTTIDNNNPDQANSTRVSFAYASDPAGRCEADPVIWDNNATNNGGYLVNKITKTGAITTDPPFITPNLSRQVAAMGNLMTLRMALMMYSFDYDDYLPTSLAQLYPAYECSASTFWNPGDADLMPTTINNAVPNTPQSALISFEFPAAGRRLSTLDMDEVVLRDNSPANNGGRGQWVVLADGRITFLAACNDPFADIDGDHDVDADDFAALQRCLSGSYAVAEGCECFNRPAPGQLYPTNSSIDGADVLKFIACGSGPAVPADIHCDD